MNNPVQVFINKDNELGKIMLRATHKNDNGGTIDCALVHDPSINTESDTSVEYGSQFCTLRLAIKDISTLEQIGNYIVEYCKKERLNKEKESSPSWLKSECEKMLEACIDGDNKVNVRVPCNESVGDLIKYFKQNFNYYQNVCFDPHCTHVDSNVAEYSLLISS